MPKDYLDFMKKHNGGEGNIGSESYMQILKLEELKDYNNDYEISDRLIGYDASEPSDS